MRHDPQKCLFDLAEAAERIVRFSDGKTIDDYLADDMFRSAVERQFTIIGESVNRLRKISSPLLTRLSDVEKIIGFRNQLVHGYDVIDHQISWKAVEAKLPTLIREVQALLIELDDQGLNL